MSKHTPGPWTTGSVADFHEGGDCVVLTADRSRMIGECYEDGEVQTDEDRANATLCAAAPDLLEALHDLVSWVETNCERVPAMVVDPADAALRKAGWK